MAEVSGATINEVGGRIGSAAARARAAGNPQAAHDAVPLEESPSALEKVEQRTMLGWMAVPLATGIAAIGRFFGRMGDRLGWFGAPFRGLRTALGVPLSALQAPIAHVSSEVMRGAQAGSARVAGLAERETEVAGRAVRNASERLGRLGGRLDQSLEAGRLRPVRHVLEWFARFRERLGQSLETGVLRPIGWVRDKIGGPREARTSARAATELRTTLGNLPGKLANMPVYEGIHHGLYGLMQVTGAYLVAKSVRSPVKALEHMYEGVTGRRASARQILAGDLPESMKEAHLWRSAVPGVLSNIAAIGVNYKYMRPSVIGGNGLVGALPMIMMMAIQGAAGLVGWVLKPKNSLIEAYQKITQAQQAGVEVPKEAIAGLLVAAKPALRKLELGDQRLLGVAQQYVEKHMTAAEVLRTIDTGQFARDFAAAKLNADINAKQQGAARPNNIAVPDGERKTDALRAKPETIGAEQHPVGDFSARIAAEKHNNGRAQAPSASHVETIQKGEPVAGVVRA